MSEENPYDDLPDPESTPNEAKSLRQAAERGAKAEAALAQAQREMAFLKAGIDTDTQLGKMFAKAYDGDLTGDAIKAAATEVGAIKVATQVETVPDYTDADKKVAEQRQALATGATIIEAHDPDPIVSAKDRFTQALEGGASSEDAMAHAIRGVMDAGRKGDERVYYKGPAQLG